MPGRSRGRARARAGGKTPRVLYSFDFTSQSAGAVSLPTGLTFARASSGHTVQDGASAIVTSGITSNDVGRVGRLSSAHSYGLYVEPARTNLILRSREIENAAWTAGSGVTTTANADAGPDGATLADRSNVGLGGYSRYQSVTSSIGQTYAFSQWIAARTSAQNHRATLTETLSSYTVLATTSAPTTWQRIASSKVATTTSVLLLPCDGFDRSGTGGPGAQAMDFFTDLHQVELGKYPTSAIVTAGAAATRAGERLSIDGTRAAASVVNGRLGVYIRLRALAASSELASTEGYLLSWATGAVLVDGTNKYLYAYDGSPDSQTANNAFSCARYDSIEFAIEVGAGPTALRWRVNGATTNTADFSVQNDSLGSLDLSAGLDVCNAAAGGQFPSIVEKVVTFAPGWGPM